MRIPVAQCEPILASVNLPRNVGDVNKVVASARRHGKLLTFGDAYETAFTQVLRAIQTSLSVHTKLFRVHVSRAWCIIIERDRRSASAGNIFIFASFVATRVRDNIPSPCALMAHRFSDSSKCVNHRDPPTIYRCGMDSLSL